MNWLETLMLAAYAAVTAWFLVVGIDDPARAVATRSPVGAVVRS